MTEGKEHRRSFRISESVYLGISVLTDQEFQDGLEHYRIRHGQGEGTQALLVDIDARLSEAMYKLSAEYDQVARCMTLLNDKINAVIEQMPELRKSKAALTSSPPLTCDVSADGLVYPSAEQLAIDTKLHLKFLLASDKRYIETFARVVRHTETPAGNDTGRLEFGIAVEFIGMLHAQREILIQHMFNRESETLRMRRLQIEAADS